MNIYSLIKLTDTDKRIIFTVLIIIILVFAIIAAIGSIIFRIIKMQGKRIDTYLSDACRTRVITDKHHFVKYATKKNFRLFQKQSWIPILIALAGGIVLIIYCGVTHNWNYNPFSFEEGFGSLIYTWDFKTMIKKAPEGSAGVLLSWPEVKHAPEFIGANWPGYVSVPLFIVGGFWYLISVQGFLGRQIRIGKLKHSIFDKSLENFNQNDQAAQEALNNQKQ